MGDKTKSMVSAVALAAFNMMGTAGAQAAAAKAPPVPAQTTAPVAAPKDSLKAEMLASHADFAKAAEAFGRDSFGLNMLVYDIDAFKTKPRSVTAFLPPASDGLVPRPVTYLSAHSEDRVAVQRPLLEQAYLERVQRQVSEKGLGGDDAAQIDKAARDMATKVSARVIKNANQGIANTDVNVKAEDAELAGAFLRFVLPEAMRAHDINVHVVVLNSSLSSQLASAAEQVSQHECTTPDPATRHIEAMERLHTTYHETAHAYSMTRPRFLPFGLENNGRDEINFNENVANGFAAAMVLRDFGRDAISYLKNNAYGDESYTLSGSDLEHYTASTTLAVIRAFENGTVNFGKMTPKNILGAVEEAAKTLALRPEDLQPMRQYRFDLEHGQMVNFSQLSNAQDAYTKILLAAGPERDKALEQLEKQAASMPAGRADVQDAALAASQLCRVNLNPALEPLSNEQSASPTAPLSRLKPGAVTAKPAP